MQLSLPSEAVIIPDESGVDEALARTTDLGIGAHPDDLEIMTWHGIGSCRGRDDRWFSAVVVTDGSGSPRSGLYANYTDARMRAVRLAEQTRAAELGGYSALLCLGLQSPRVRDRIDRALVADLAAIIGAARPEVVYTHSPFDGHPTHAGVMAHAIEALRQLGPEQRPRAIYGCEVWGSLDWLPKGRRVSFDVSEHAELGTRLIAAHQSQVAGGKRYDLATAARKRANATYRDARAIDGATLIEYAIDLTPLLDPSVGVVDFAAEILEDFSCEVAARLHPFGP